MFAICCKRTGAWVPLMCSSSQTRVHPAKRKQQKTSAGKDWLTSCCLTFPIKSPWTTQCASRRSFRQTTVVHVSSSVCASGDNESVTQKEQNEMLLMSLLSLFQLAKAYGMDFFETSAFTNHNITEVRLSGRNSLKETQNHVFIYI